MAEPPVVNASPLIFLARSGLIEILKLAGEEVLVPLPVAAEIRRRDVDDPTCRALDQNPWIRIPAEVPMIPDSIKAWGLGEGESAVLAWCVAHRGAEAIIDDLAARRCAAGLGISVRGTLGLVLTAKQQGLVASARSVLETMRGAGMYLSDRILVEALALVGE